MCSEERVRDNVWLLLLEVYGGEGQVELEQGAGVGRESGRSLVWIFRGGFPVGRHSAG